MIVLLHVNYTTYYTYLLLTSYYIGNNDLITHLHTEGETQVSQLL